MNVYGERREVETMKDTWGHLRPSSGRHSGQLIAAVSAYSDNRMLITADFANVEDSPWLYEAMYDLIYAADLEQFGVYRFTGAVIVSRSRIRFDGFWSRIPLAENGETS